MTPIIKYESVFEIITLNKLLFLSFLFFVLSNEFHNL